MLVAMVVRIGGRCKDFVGTYVNSELIVLVTVVRLYQGT